MPRSLATKLNQLRKELSELKTWISETIHAKKKKSRLNWSKIIDRIKEKRISKAEAKPKLVQVEYKIYQEREPIIGFNGKPLRNPYHSWIQEHPNTNWVKFRERFFVNDHEGTREMLLPEEVLGAEKTTILNIKHNGVKVADVVDAGQGKFLDGVFHRDDKEGFLPNVLDLATKSDATAALELASRYPIVIQIIKIQSAPEQNVPTRHPTKRPVGAWKVFSSPYLNSNIDLFADVWDHAFAGEFLHHNDCAYSAIIQTWGDRVCAYLDEHPNSTKYLPVNHETIYMICKYGPPISKGEMKRSQRHLFPTWKNSEPFPGVENLPKLTFEEMCRWFDYYKVNADLHYEDGELIQEKCADEPNHDWKVKLKLMIKDDHVYVVSTEPNNKKALTQLQPKAVPTESKYFVMKKPPILFDSMVSSMDEALKEIQNTILAHQAVGCHPERIRIAWSKGTDDKHHGFLKAVIQTMHEASFCPEIHKGSRGRPSKIKLYHEGIPITIEDFELGCFHTAQNEDFTLDNINKYLTFQNNIRQASSSSYVSTYGPRVLLLLKRLRCAPPRIAFQEYDPNDLVSSIDGVKAYPSILINMPFVVSLHETDVIQPFDGLELRPETLYVSKVKDSMTLDEDALIFPSDINLHYGYHLKHFEDKVDILFMIIPTFVHTRNPWRQPYIDLATSDLPNQMKKPLFVSSIGEFGMNVKKTGIDKVCCTLEEAQDFQNRKGGKIWLMGEWFRNRVDYQCDTSSGFLPVQHFIYTEQRFRLWKKVKKLKFQNVIGVNVDEILMKVGTPHGCKSKKDHVARAFDPTFWGKNGKFLYQGDKFFNSKPGVPVKQFERDCFSFDIIPFSRKPKIHSNDEETLESFSLKLKNGKFVKGPVSSKRFAIVAGTGGAGAGKTSLASSIIKSLKTDNFAVAVPENSLGQDSRFEDSKGVNKAMTYHRLLGMRPSKDSEEVEKFSESSGYDVIFCDEFNKVDVWVQQSMIDYVKKHPQTQFIFAYDEYQLRAIYDRSRPLNPYYRQNHRLLVKKFINMVCDDMIVLKKSRRQKDALQRWKDVYSRNRLSIEELLVKYCGGESITLDEAIAMDAEYLVYRNSFRVAINHLKHTFLKKPRFYAGQKLVYKFKTSMGKVHKIHINYVLEVKSVGENIVLYHEPTKTTHTLITAEMSRFEDVFAKTIHQRQGETLKKPAIVCDWSNDRDWWYVALTRTFEGVPMYWVAPKDIPGATLDVAAEDIILNKMIAGLNTSDRKDHRAGNNLTVEKVRALLNLHDWKCWMCANPLEITKNRKADQPCAFVLDRIISKLIDCEYREKPLHNIDNVRPCCNSCNCSKKALLIL